MYINDPEIQTSSDIPENLIVDRLIDDCIIQIFEYLPLRDLCNVTGVCSVFKLNALSVFKRFFADVDLSELIDENAIDSRLDCEDDENVGQLSPPTETIERLFRDFGAHIQSLCLNGSDFNENQKDQILELMITNCAQKDSKLTKLVLQFVTIGADLMPRFHSLFDRLNSLEAMDASFYFGSELTELILEDIYLDCNSVRRLKKLQSASFIDVCNVDGAFHKFVTLNSHLKSLSITGSKKWSYSDFLLTEIGTFSVLEELKLKIFHSNFYGTVQEDLSNLARLKHLKVFSFNCVGLPITKLLNDLAEQTEIEELDLREFTLSHDVVLALAKFTKLRKLRLSDGGQVENGKISDAVKGMTHLEKLYLSNFGHITIDDIKKTIMNATELNELQLDCQLHSFTVDTTNFNLICRFAKRSNGIKLKLNISGVYCKFDVPQYIVEENKSWLEVNVMTFKKVEPMNVIDYYDFSSEESSDSSDSNESESSDESVKSESSGDDPSWRIDVY